MTLTLWPRDHTAGWKRSRPSPGQRRARSPCRSIRPQVEPLEGRLILSALVINTGDNGGVDPAPFAGTGTLRQAIIDVNATGVADSIVFALPDGLKSPGGWWTIQPASPLPAVTAPVTIDATPTPGYAGTPLIELDGTNAGDLANGLEISGGNSVVRGLVINHFGGTGILLDTAGWNLITGNYLGTDPTGTTAEPNGRGLGINYVGRNTIGGTAPGDRNVISGNHNSGIYIFGTGAVGGNVLQGNYVGIDANGSMPLGNGSGVDLFYASSNTIGGTAPGQGNVISGNTGAGIHISGTGTGENWVAGNYIGTDATGIQPVGNNVGVLLDYYTIDNTVGGTADGAGNVIAFNSGPGVALPMSGTGNAILRNAIFENTGLGIDLGGDGVTPNDPGDGDTGPNNLQNFPVLTAATLSGGNIAVRGTLDSTPSMSFLIEFFTNDFPDPSGYGQGQRFLGATSVMTDSSGNAAFFYSAPAQPGSFVTATATVLMAQWLGESGTVIKYIDTSEFSSAFPVLPIPTVSFTSAAQSVAENAVPNTVTITVQMSPSSEEDVTIPFTVSGTATNPDDYTLSPSLLTIPAGATTATLILTVNDDTLVEGNETVVITLGTPTNAELGAITQHTVTILDNDNAPPTATLSNSGPVNESSPVSVSFSNPYDPSSADTAAGFHYSFALDPSGLATTYAGASDAASTQLTFDDNGSYTVYGRIFAQDGGYTDYTTTVTVNNVPPTAALSNSGPVDEGSPVTVSLSNPYDPSSADTAAGFHYSFALDPSGLATTYAGASDAASAQFTFADNGSYSVYGRIFDKDGGYTDYATTVIVNNVPPTATLSNNGPVADGSTATVSFGGQFDPSAADTLAGFRYAYDFNNDGVFEIGDGTYAGSVSSPSAVVPSDLLPAGGTLIVRARILDKDGGFTDYFTSIEVQSSPAAQNTPTTSWLSFPGVIIPSVPLFTLPLALAPVVVSTPTPPAVEAPFEIYVTVTVSGPGAVALPEIREITFDPSVSLPQPLSANTTLLQPFLAGFGYPEAAGAENSEDRTATMMAAQLLSAAFEGDDSVHLFEDLLQGPSPPSAVIFTGPAEVTTPPLPVPQQPPGAVPQTVSEPPAPEASTPLALLAKWLAVPAAAAIGAAVWLWLHAHTGHRRTPPDGPPGTTPTPPRRRVGAVPERCTKP